ncbi:MAG: hypothetical protein AAF721_30445 [Myxococcota bacterium]
MTTTERRWAAIAIGLCIAGCAAQPSGEAPDLAGSGGPSVVHTDGTGSGSTSSADDTSAAGTTGSPAQRSGSTAAERPEPDSSGGIKFDMDGDLPVVDCVEGCEDLNGPRDVGAWLLHFNTGPTINQARMARVSVSTGETTELCDLVGDSLAQGAFKSSTFTRDNRLLASDGRSLYEVDQCACTYALIGDFPLGTRQIYGIAPDEGDGLFGISAAARALVRIDTETAEPTIVGELGLEVVTSHGLAWSEASGQLLMVESGTDALYDVDPQTGLATLIAVLSTPTNAVGLEIHPDTDELFLCGPPDGKIHLVDRETAITTPLVDGPPSCKNLGAPWASGGMICVPEG